MHLLGSQSRVTFPEEHLGIQLQGGGPAVAGALLVWCQLTSSRSFKYPQAEALPASIVMVNTSSIY